MRAWRNAIEPLWVLGLALLCLFAGHVVLTGPWLGLRGKPYDWGQYLVAGVVFPALLFGAPLLWRWRGWPTAPAAAVKPLLVIACLAVFVVFAWASLEKFGPRRHLLPLLLAVGQVVITQVVMPRPPWRRADLDPARLTAGFVVALVAWTAALSLYLEVLTEPPVFATGFAVAFLLVCAAVGDAAAGWRPGRMRLWAPANVVAVVFLGLMNLRTDGLFELLGMRGAIHHWGAWVGSADLFHEGAWFLWDLPSNYGFLNVLLFALIPTETPWQAFYLVTALASFLVSVGIFLGLRALRPGPLNWCFALAAAVAIPLFVPTFNAAGPVTSTLTFPNWGVYRAFWSFVLVAILLWERTTEERSRRQAWSLVVGCVAWLIGFLWSPESAFFCTGAWLPAYVAIVLRTFAASRAGWRRAVAWLALPPALLGATLGGMAAFYAARLGHLPDWLSYFDYAREVGLNVLVVVNEPVGPALGMLIGFLALTTGAVYAGTRGGVPTRSFGLWIGLLGASWAANSYGYQRGATFLHPVAYAALGVMLVLVARRPRAGGWDVLARAGAVPLLVIVLASPLAAVVANPLDAGEALASVGRTARAGFAVEPLIPDEDAGLRALLAEAGVRPEDPIAFFGDDLGNLLRPWTPGGEADGERVVVTPHWLPAHPSLALRWIPPGRGAVYTARFIERAKLGGWMIQRKTGLNSNADFNAFVSGREPWLFDLLRESHVATRIYENADWQLLWFDYVGDRPEVARPTDAWRMPGPLPPDVLVDGRPLAGTAHPELWTRYGTGWGKFDPAGGGRRMASGAELWVYSPERRTASVRLTTTSALGRRGLVVGVNGVPPQPATLEGEQTFRAPVGLEGGWNRVEFRVGADPMPNRTERTAARRAERGQDGAPTRKASRGEAGDGPGARERRSGATPPPIATPAAAATPAGEAVSAEVGTPVAGASSSALNGGRGLGMAVERIEIET